MKPLVCVAPDGSLEVWDKGGRTWYCLYYSGIDFCAAVYGLPNGPEFWGRVVLGEL